MVRVDGKWQREIPEEEWEKENSRWIVEGERKVRKKNGKSN